MRYASRRDENERPIIDSLKAAGWGVHQVDATGFPDLVVSRGCRTFLIEVIGDAKAAKYRKTNGLTPAQVTFHRGWPGTIHLARSAEEALAIVRSR